MRLRVLRRLVLEEEFNTRGNVADFLRLRFSLPGELIFKAALCLLRLRPRARPGLLAVLFAVLSPAKVLAARATLGEFVPGVFTTGTVPNEDSD
jgi:hypothetical protein